MKMLRVEAVLSWPELEKKILEKFASGTDSSFIIKYKDAAGDLITLESQEDFDFAIELFDKNFSGTLQVSVVVWCGVVRCGAVCFGSYGGKLTLSRSIQVFLFEKPTSKGLDSSSNISTRSGFMAPPPPPPWSFSFLSKEISIRIFAMLSDPKDLAKVALICKTWKQYLDEGEQALWKNMFAR